MGASIRSEGILALAAAPRRTHDLFAGNLMFATVLHNLRGPRNVGQIIRSHVAYGGGPLLFVGHDEPWDFRKSTSRYSRNLEQDCDILHMPNNDAFFEWCVEIIIPQSLSKLPILHGSWPTSVFRHVPPSSSETRVRGC